MSMKLLARLMTVLYLLLVIFVIFHQFGFQTDLMQNPRPLVFVAMGILSFIVLNKVIDEVSDKPADGEGDD
jgi:predicted membrane channel-forming protein YqfA (hemolysin III family)